MLIRRLTTVVAAAAALVAATAPASEAKLPRLPRAWPARTFALGLTDSPGGAAALKRSGGLRFRYQYLAAGVNTGNGWATWNENGTFVDRYVGESARAGVTPVFSYYMIRQSLPGRDNGDEPAAVLSNLRNTATMRAWLADVRLFFERAGRFPRTRVVLQVEPDMWGYGQQAARNDDASTVPVAEVGDLGGLARAVVDLRNRLAPNVVLGWHLSDWGTKVDLTLNDPSLRRTGMLARRSARFYRSLHARFDVTFTDFADRDASFKRKIYGAGQDIWWTAADYRRELGFLGTYSRAAHQRVVAWQIPLGNTLMRAMNDTWGHFQDNHVQWALGSRRHLRSLARAGVIALLFGGGADGTTCACDGRHDGVTNPAPINGNTRGSLSADDDGGYFRARARAIRPYARSLRLR
ncbi:MAG: hypothetical protein QOD43_189 [Gaiellaceae bacterium]|nr:hypothetical protein [Gaiellaceae bacterium]